MTRESKLALIVGFSLVLVVGVLISDHFSKARAAHIQMASAADPIAPPTAPTVTPTPPVATPVAQLTDRPDAPLPVGAGEVPSVPDPTRVAAANPPPVATIDMAKPQIASATGLEDGTTGRGGLSPLNRTVTEPVGQTPERTVSLPPTPPGPSKPGPQSTPKPSAPTRPVTTGDLKQHEVIKGDTISSIAFKYYGDRKLWRQLQAYNRSKVSADGEMRLGTTLQIPPKDVLLGQAVLKSDAVGPVSPVGPAQKSPDKAGPASTEKPKAAPAPIYVVQAGDTLARIAERQLGSKGRWQQIRDLNTDTLEDDDTLQVGMKLKLPAR